MEQHDQGRANPLSQDHVGSGEQTARLSLCALKVNEKSDRGILRAQSVGIWSAFRVINWLVFE